MRGSGFSRELATLDAIPAPRKMPPVRSIHNRSYLFDVPDPRSDQDPFACVDRHHHDGPAQEGAAECLVAGDASAAAGTEAAGRTGLYLAFRARAGGSGHAGIMVIAHFDPDRDRSHAR